jgi:hypothetical protein
MMEFREYLFILMFVSSLMLSYTLTMVDIGNAQNVTTAGNVTQSINKTGLGVYLQILPLVFQKKLQILQKIYWEIRAEIKLAIKVE